MPRFLNTLGNSTLSIFICGRCKMKRPEDEAHPDANFPGVIVCERGCGDEKDPYRLPARKTEKITIRYPRPDLSVAVDSHAIDTGGYQGYVLSTQANTSTPEQNGNVDGLEIQP
jgi:hypothetical protein